MMILIFLISISNIGKISGIVKQKGSNISLPFAIIEVIEIKKRVLSDENGKFIIDNIPVGNYTVRCSYTGYKPEIKLKIFVYPGRITELIFELTPIEYEFEEIIVKVEPYSKEELETPSLFNFSSTEIYYKPGTFTDIQRALKSLPSVFGRDNLNEIIVKGGNPDENLIVVNNIEFSNLSYFPLFGSSGGAIFIMDQTLVDNLNFYSGIFPVRYGDKISSVLDLKIKKGNNQKTQVELEPGIGGIKVNLEGPIKGNNSFNLLFGLTNQAWLIPYLKKISKEMKEVLIGIPEKLLLSTFQGNINFTSKNYLIEGVWIYGGNELLLKSLPFKRDSIDLNNKNHTYGFGINIYKFYKNNYTLLNLHTTSNKWAWINRKSDNSKEVLKNFSEISSYKIRLENKFKFILFGIEYKLERINYIFDSYPDSLFYYEYSPTNPDSVTKKTLIDVRENDVNSLNYSYKLSTYLQYEYPLFKFIINPGIRLDYFEYIKEYVLSPRVKISYPFNFFKIPFYFNIGVGRYHQSPNPAILYLTTENKNLKHYFSDNYLIGLNFLVKDYKISLEFYYRFYSKIPVNLAYTTLEPNDFSKIYLSKGRSLTKGIDFYIQKKFLDNLFLNLCFSHSYSYKMDLRKNEWVPNDFDQRNIFGFMLGYLISYKDFEWFKNLEKNKWYKVLKYIPILNLFTIFIDDEVTYSLSLRYSSGKPYTEKVYLKEYKRWTILENTPINSKRIKDYFRVDIRINTRNLYSKFLKIPCNYESYIEFINITNYNNVYDYFWVDETQEKIELKELPFSISAGWKVKF